MQTQWAMVMRNLIGFYCRPESAEPQLCRLEMQSGRFRILMATERSFRAVYGITVQAQDRFAI